MRSHKVGLAQELTEVKTAQEESGETKVETGDLGLPPLSSISTSP